MEVTEAQQVDSRFRTETDSRIWCNTRFGGRPKWRRQIQCDTKFGRRPNSGRRIWCNTKFGRRRNQNRRGQGCRSLDSARRGRKRPQDRGHRLRSCPDRLSQQGEAWPVDAFAGGTRLYVRQGAVLDVEGRWKADRPAQNGRPGRERSRGEAGRAGLGLDAAAAELMALKDAIWKLKQSEPEGANRLEGPLASLAEILGCELKTKGGGE